MQALVVLVQRERMVRMDFLVLMDKGGPQKMQVSMMRL
jgi:hypothetical protein